MTSFPFARLLTFSLFFLTSFSLIAMEKPAKKSKEDQLWDAITEKELAKVQSLIRVNPTDTKPLDINHRYFHSANQSVLMHAIQIGDPRAIRLIAQVPGLDVTIKDRYGWSALSWAVFSDSAAPLQILVQFRKQFVPALDFNERRHYGQTALSYALEHEHVERALLLCQEDSVDPNIPDIATGYYALHHAMRGTDKESLRIIRLLIDKGAQINCKTRNDKSPLDLAFDRLLRDEGWDISPTRVIALLAFGSPVNHRPNSPQAVCFLYTINTRLLTYTGLITFCDQRGKESLIHGEGNSVWKETAWFLKELILGDWLDTSKARENIDKLVECGADLNARDTVYGMTRLMWAAARNHVGFFLVLIDHPEVDLNKTDNFGDTALHYAARNASSHCVRGLLEHPKTISGIRNVENKSALDLARMREYQHIIALFDGFIARKRAPIALWLRKSEHFNKLPWEIILKIAKLCR